MGYEKLHMWDQQNNYLNNIVRSELTVTFNYFSSIGSINTEVEEKYENNQPLQKTVYLNLCSELFLNNTNH